MSQETPLTTGRIFRFYYPLALSWLFMAIESPVSIALISRLAEPKLQTATFLALMGLALWIESPIIDLLATSTTLCRDKPSFAVLSRFVWWLMGWCTVFHALIVLTPLYGLVTERVLSLPHEVSAALHAPLTLMIPWSACIGWRRFRQGILIRHGQTRAVGLGTAVRLTTMTATGILLALTGKLRGTEVAAIALIASVGAEALFAHWASRDTARLLPEGKGTDLTMGSLARFHLPLTATTILTLSTGPIVIAALAKSGNAVLAMASWQVMSTLLWMHRTVVFALPEMVIALYRGPESIAKLRSFCVGVGGAASGVLALLWMSRVDVAFFRFALGAPLDTASLAHTALGLCVLLPVIGALQSYARGMLTVHHRTMPRLLAVSAGMATLLAGLGIGLWAKWPGIVLAASALTLGLLAEWAVLAWANVRSLRTAAA